MANSLESEAEENEKKEMEYSSSAPNKSLHVNRASKNHNTPWNSGFALSETMKGIEVWKAIMFVMLG